MPAERYFLDASFDRGQEALMEDEEMHHLIRVMRTEIGEEVELVNGKGQLAIAKLTSVDKHSAHLMVENVQTAKPSSRLILAQALPKLNRLETIIEKGTELNVTEFWLFPGQYSEKKEISPSQEKRLKQIVISALKQCGRLDLPQILFKDRLDKWPSLKIYRNNLKNWEFGKEAPQNFDSERATIAEWQGVNESQNSEEGPTKPKPNSSSCLGINCYFGDTRKIAPSFKKSFNEQLFFIGPEKGFSDREVETMENKFQAQGVKLHNNILRVDTAAIIASFLCSNHS